jgi:hypothetical protein
MKKSGVKFNTFPKGRKCWVHPGEEHILAAAELADWIQKSNIPNILITENVTGENWREKVESRKGIICFEDYYPYSCIKNAGFLWKTSRFAVSNTTFSQASGSH